MSVSICVLGSGSRGNCTFVSDGATRLLIDAGLSGREIGRRLESIGETIENMDAVCLTHEHSDHISGLPALCMKRGIPVYANAGTVEGCAGKPKLKTITWNVFATGSAFDIGSLDIQPFPVLHDAYEPVGFRVAGRDFGITIVTDMGAATDIVCRMLAGSDIAVIEANHDEQMLGDSDRPAILKLRIGSRQGHMSNRATAELLASLDPFPLKAVFLAHLSADCNTHAAAVNTVQAALCGLGRDIPVIPTYSDRPSARFDG